MTDASNVTCSQKAEQKGLPLTITRMMGLTTAALMLGGVKNLASPMGITERALHHKLAGTRGTSDADLLAAADALDMLVARIAGHAAKLRAEAVEPRKAVSEKRQGVSEEAATG